MRKTRTLTFLIFSTLVLPGAIESKPISRTRYLACLKALQDTGRESSSRLGDLKASALVKVPGTNRVRVIQAFWDHEVIAIESDGTRFLLNGRSNPNTARIFIVANQSGSHFAVTVKKPHRTGQMIDPSGDGHGVKTNQGFGVLLFKNDPQGITEIPLSHLRPETFFDNTELLGFSPSNSRRDPLVPELFATQVSHYGYEGSTGHPVLGFRFYRLNGRPYWTVAPKQKQLGADFRGRQGDPYFSAAGVHSMKFSKDGRYLNVVIQPKTDSTPASGFKLDLLEKRVIHF